MNSQSQETFRRVTLNDPSLTILRIVYYNGVVDGQFYSDSDDYSALGAAVANNTYLEILSVLLSDDVPLGVADRGFYNGLKSNSSINNLSLYCNSHNIAGGVEHEILKVYQEYNSQLTFLGIANANLQNGGDRVIGDTLRNCRNLQRFDLNDCNITYEQLLPIIDAVRGHRMLEELILNGSNIGNAGCVAIAALLTDPNCNLRALYLGNNAITTEGAITVANSLRTNNKLQRLYLRDNPVDQSIEDTFCKVLCNTTSIRHTYSSNHALKTFDLGGQPLSQHLESLLKLNKDTDNEHHASIKKILKYHPNIDAEPLFEWGVEEDDEERNLKALPYVIDWFDRAGVAVAEEDDNSTYHIEERKLSAIFQFAKSMPLLFDGISDIGSSSNKRKRAP